MRDALLRMEFFETYYYANIVHNVLDDTMDFLRNLHSWHEDREASLFLQPFPKWSVLHDFAQYVIEDLMYERLNDVTPGGLLSNPRASLWVDRALAQHGIKTEGFRAWLTQHGVILDAATEDHIHDYHTDLRPSHRRTRCALDSADQ